MLVGGAGFTAMWHACTLHGTQPDAADNERLSLRYLFAKRPGARGGLDAVNATPATARCRLGDTRAGPATTTRRRAGSRPNSVNKPSRLGEASRLSITTSLFTELAMKHSSWARWCRPASSSGVGCARR